MSTPAIYNTREAAEIIAKANLLPSQAKPLSQRSVERLCRLNKIPGSYVMQGDWCIPQTAIDDYIDAIKSNKNGRKRRGKEKTD